MREEDAEQKAEKPERNRKVGGGTAEDTTSARQALTARGDKANDEASLLIEEVLRRENMMKAHKRVVANGGAPGVDGIEDVKKLVETVMSDSWSFPDSST